MRLNQAVAGGHPPNRTRFAGRLDSSGWVKSGILPMAFLVLASCTYGEPTGMLELDYVIDDGGSRAAILAERHVIQRPTGVAAFPDGGSPKVTDQFLDVYVVDLATRRILYRHTIDPPGKQGMASLTTWLPGWKDEAVYVRLEGCAAGLRTAFKGCEAERRQAHVYRVSSDGVEPADLPASRLARHKRFGGVAGAGAPSGTRSYLSTSDGVWIQHGAGGPREPLLRVNGQRLEQVVD